MTKLKIVLLVLVVALAVTGTAYASWTQTVRVENRVETGRLRVDVSAQSSAYVSENWSDESISFNPSSTATVNGNNVSFSGSNFFPGTVQVAEMKLINSGTIPVNIEIINVNETMPTNVDYVVEITTEDESVTYRGEALNIISGKYATLDVSETINLKITTTFSGDNTENDMKESSIYNYSFVFDVSQFNYGHR